MLKRIIALAVLLFAAHAWAAEKVDVCVYGGTAGGVAAAVTVYKEGKSVILIEPGRHLGGMSSGGLGQTDFGNKQVIGGLSRQFYKRVGKFYGQEEGWQFQPHHAEAVFEEWVKENKLNVVREQRLKSVRKEGKRIIAIVLEKAPTDELNAQVADASGDGLEIEAKVFIDATYEGDLMAKAGVSYTVGRESSAQYGEPLNGIRAKTPLHQFLVKVDPYVKPGDAESGLIPLSQSGDGGRAGDGDKRVQVYNFRMCLTKDAKNKIPITAPPGYEERTYELLARLLEANAVAKKKVTVGQLMKLDLLPGGKTDINNNGAVSTDYIGMNYDYPDGDYATRGKIWRDHVNYTRGFFYFLANSPRVPEDIRKEVGAWGFCGDEFVDTGGWPHQMYIREARRMVGEYVVTQADCEHKRAAVNDSVGMGAYNMDSHNCQRIVRNGAVENEGDVQVRPSGPYAVPYRAITPKREECENLLVPICLSATHIAYGSIRMEPVFMVLGESSAMAACQSIDETKSVQEIDAAKLKKKLLEAGQVLEFKPK